MVISPAANKSGPAERFNTNSIWGARGKDDISGFVPFLRGNQYCRHAVRLCNHVLCDFTIKVRVFRRARKITGTDYQLHVRPSVGQPA